LCPRHLQLGKRHRFSNFFLAGAAIKVGTETAYTNADGEFMVRVKKNVSVAVSVDVGSFTAPGNWRCIECPATAKPGDPVLITVARQRWNTSLSIYATFCAALLDTTRSGPTLRTMFKSKVRIDEFAGYLAQFHGSVFGISALAETCEVCRFHFRDEASHADALWEWLTFGLYSISVGVGTQCNPNLRRAIIDSLHKQFFTGLAEAGAEGERLVGIQERIRISLAEYADFGSRRPIDALAVQKIFDRPVGILPATSHQAIELRIAINKRWDGTLKEAAKLFRQFVVIA
jgi:hypothetical protein